MQVVHYMYMYFATHFEEGPMYIYPCVTLTFLP